MLPAFYQLAQAGPAARATGARRQRARRRRPRELPHARAQRARPSSGRRRRRATPGRASPSGCASPAAASHSDDPGSLLDVLGEARDELGSDAQLVHYLAVPPVAFAGDHRGAGRARAGRGRPGRLREAVRHLAGQLPRARRGRARRPRRAAGLPHRPLPGQGGDPEPARAALRQRPVRRGVEQRARPRRADRRAGEPRTSPTAPSSTTPPARCWTCSSPTCSRSPPRSRWSRRRAWTPSTCRPRASRSSARSARSTRTRSCWASSRATATSTASTPTRRRTPSSPPGCGSTTTAGAACRSCCAPASGWPAARSGSASILREPDGTLAERAQARQRAGLRSQRRRARSSLRLVAKKPGAGTGPGRRRGEHRARRSCRRRDPLPPYVRLIHDVLIGDRSLFTRPDGLAAVWDAAAPAAERTGPTPQPYAPGSWGPAGRRTSWPSRTAGCSASDRADAAARSGTIAGVLRWITAGESHGPALVAVARRPAGRRRGHHARTSRRDLARRRLGYGRGARMKFEQDEVELTGGVRHGRTMGGPVAVRVGNTEWPKWETVMSADPVDPQLLAEQARNAPLTRPAARPRRPGRHAEVRRRRRPAGAGAGQRPRDGGAGRARRGGQGVPAPGGWACEVLSHVVGDRHGARPGRGAARAG